MDYKKFSVKTWDSLDSSGNSDSGYFSTWLSVNENQPSNLHIFKDEKGYCHFAIEVNTIEQLDDPKVNGLQLTLATYRLDGNNVKSVIDLRCNISNYIEEFTGVAADISKNILEHGGEPFEVVNRVIKNWMAFWSSQNRQTLSEESQIGLICELAILQEIGRMNPSSALSSWNGPLGNRHDFNFTDWNLEVKGTRRDNHTHTINGIDQLSAADGKRLAFVSTLVTVSDNENALSLPDVIDQVIQNLFGRNPELVIGFLKLLANAGYNPLGADHYREFKIEILESILFVVDDAFPKLTEDSLISPLDNRIKNIRYNITLEGRNGIRTRDLNWGNYFY